MNADKGFKLLPPVFNRNLCFPFCIRLIWFVVILTGQELSYAYSEMIMVFGRDTHQRNDLTGDFNRFEKK